LRIFDCSFRVGLVKEVLERNPAKSAAMKRPLLILAVALGVAGPLGREPRAAAGEIRLSSQTIQVIGYRIWRNECDLTVEGLTSWNDGEDFASLGIGHFIWYPKGKRPRITESFPTMVAFLRERQVELPAWLTETSDCPWNSRAEFLRALQDPRMVELRQLLARTVPEQTTFMVARLREALPRMVEAAPPPRRQDLIFQLYRVAQTQHGAYALVDYINFKGEGGRASSSGLVQVLENMHGRTPGLAAVQEFAQSAKQVLAQRVAGSSPAHGEARWLAGWYNRIDTYTQ
jgi:hypothetical protein